MFRKTIVTACAALMATTTIASAQNYSPPPGSDPQGYYSRYDGDGYYDRNGRYQRYNTDQRLNNDRNTPPPPPVSDNSYRQGTYETNCRSNNSNQVAGTIFGALAGGLIGSAASRGNGGAVVGGAVLGGLLGNALTRDVPCEDQGVAFRVYADGLNGPIGRRNEWRQGNDYGYFTPEREFRRGGYTCRTFTTITYRGGRSYDRTGTACRWNDGNWHFDN